MYPIAWAAVEVENKDSWFWFMALLNKDLEIENQGEGCVFISDQQKGLINDVSKVVPNAEHRNCARHMMSTTQPSSCRPLLGPQAQGFVGQ
jgi:hypothetical protein